MKVNFKYPRSIDGLHYPVGVHELDNKLKSHWYFLALQANHSVKIVGESEPKKSDQLLPSSDLNEQAQSEAPLLAEESEPAQLNDEVSASDDSSDEKSQATQKASRRNKRG